MFWEETIPFGPTENRFVILASKEGRGLVGKEAGGSDVERDGTVQTKGW